MQWFRAVENMTFSPPGSYAYINGWFEGDLVAVTFDLAVLDSNTGEERRLTYIEPFLTSLALIPGIRRSLRNMLVKIAEHEVDENLRFNDSKMFDPHKDRLRIQGVIY